MTTGTDARLAFKQTAFHEIPIIDIAPLLDGSDAEGVAQQIGKVCEEVGFFYIKNHGVPDAQIEGAYDAAKSLFGLPFETKQKVNIATTGDVLRGYIPTYAENADPENSRDFKEAFDFGVAEPEVSRFFGPNPMPEELPEFKQVAEAYHDTMLTLARKLVSAIALSLDLPADHFGSIHSKPITIQRFLHYPPQQGEVSQEEIGIGAHTHYGFLTILNQDTVGGLQVRNLEGEWISAPPVEGTFIINIGDIVQTLTNGRYSSTVHRVINRSGAERYSIPFFIDADYDAVIEPLPNCVTEDRPAAYQPFTCGEYKYGRFVDVYQHLQQAKTA